MDLQQIIALGIFARPGPLMVSELQLTILFGIFFFAIGACVGSFLNVVIWRLPNRGREVIFKEKRGSMTLSWPPSHCPVCDAPIRWYQNVPVLSWIVLRAKCANCGTGIPVRYPLVELGTAVLFTGFYCAYFVGHWQPGFTDIRQWPQAGALTLHLVFMAALLAASAIDADLYIIPLSIPWFLIVVGLAAAVFIDHPAIWALNTHNGWWLAKPIAGAAIGLVLSNILLHLKILPRSFSPEFLEREQLERQEAAAKLEKKEDKKKSPKVERDQEETMAPPPKLTHFGPSAITTAVLVLVAAACWIFLSAQAAALITVIAAIFVFLIGVLPRDADQVDVTDEVLEEISSPHARREVLKEVPFLLVPILCGVIAYYLPGDLPRYGWLARLLGSLLGLLVGGGAVWFVRVAGTLGFNKEAMGMGDAHLMAGVGAIVGPPLVIVAFFTAPFIAILWSIVLKIMGKPNVLPYGPWLSVASILSLLLGNPLIAWYFKFFLP